MTLFETIEYGYLTNGRFWLLVGWVVASCVAWYFREEILDFLEFPYRPSGGISLVVFFAVLLALAGWWRGSGEVALIEGLQADCPSFDCPKHVRERLDELGAEPKEYEGWQRLQKY